MKKRPVLVSELAKAAKTTGTGSASTPKPRPKRAPEADGAYRFVSDNLHAATRGGGTRPRGRRLNLIRMVKGAMRALRETARGFQEKGVLGSTRELAEKSVACLFARITTRI